MKTKTILIEIILIFMFLSCTKITDKESIKVTIKESSKENPKEITNVQLDPWGTKHYNFSIEREFTPVCPAYPEFFTTYDVAVYFSEPLPHDALLYFRVYACKKHSNGEYYGFNQVISPWPMLDAAEGSKKVLLDASCFLPNYISCDSVLVVKTGYFKIILDSVQYLFSNDPFDYVPLDDKNYVYTEAKKYCNDFGGGGGL